MYTTSTCTGTPQATTVLSLGSCSASGSNFRVYNKLSCSSGTPTTPTGLVTVTGYTGSSCSGSISSVTAYGSGCLASTATSARFTCNSTHYWQQTFSDTSCGTQSSIAYTSLGCRTTTSAACSTSGTSGATAITTALATVVVSGAVLVVSMVAAAMSGGGVAS